MGIIVKGNPNRGLFGATLGFFVGFAAVALFGATAQKFNEVMHLTPVMIGVLVAISSLSGSLLRIPLLAIVIHWIGWNGYGDGFNVFVLLAILSLSMAYALKRTRVAKAKIPVPRISN